MIKIATTYLTTYLTTLCLFVALDAIWLGYVAKRFYRSELGALMTDSFNIWAVVAFYLIYAFGVVIFAVASTNSSRDALLWGALFGFFAYATYDLTNLATIRAWPLRLTFVDLAWGTLLTGIVAAAAHGLTRSSH